MRSLISKVILLGVLTAFGHGCGPNFKSVENLSIEDDDIPVPVREEPVVEILSGPENPNSLPKQTFTFGGNSSDVTFECKLDSSTFQVCASPFEILTANLESGEHRLVVRGKNSDEDTSAPTSPYIWTIRDVETPVTFRSDIETAISTNKCISRSNTQIVCNDLVYDILQPQNRSADLKLDLYLPKNPIGKRLPLIVFIHGGGWMQGNRKTRCYNGVTTFVTKGYAVACITYRLTVAGGLVSGERVPTASFPAQIKDVRTAVQFLRKHAGTTLDPNRFGAWGGSAGGHLAALLGTSANDPTLEGRGDASVSSRVHAVVNYCGPTNLDFFVKGPMRTSVSFPEVFVGGPTGRSPSILTDPSKDLIMRQIDPATWLDKDDPPMFIVHGDADRTVPVQSSRYLHLKLQEANVKSIYVELPGVDHGFLPVHLPQQVENFFKEHL